MEYTVNVKMDVEHEFSNGWTAYGYAEADVKLNEDSFLGWENDEFSIDWLADENGDEIDKSLLSKKQIREASNDAYSRMEKEAVLQQIPTPMEW